jgi:hypothetical protein
MSLRHNSSDKTLLFPRLHLGCRKDLRPRRLDTEDRKSIFLLASVHPHNKVSRISCRRALDRLEGYLVRHLGCQLDSCRRLDLRHQFRSRVHRDMGGGEIMVS